MVVFPALMRAERETRSDGRIEKQKMAERERLKERDRVMRESKRERENGPEN